MRSRPSSLHIAFGAAFIVSSAASAQATAARSAPRTVGESPSQFTRILSASELGSGLIVAIDHRDRSISIVDVRKGSARAFARSGAGPREVGLPWRLVSLGDSAAIVDPQHARMLIVRADGTPGAFVSTPTGGGSEPFGAVAQSARVLTDGTLLTERRTPDGLILVRTTRSGAGQSVATLAQTPVPGAAPSRGSGTPTVVRRVDPGSGNLNPFPYPGEVWELAPDGWVVIASREPYRVTWISPSGARAEGPAVPVEARAVTPATRDSLATDHVRDAPGLGEARVGRYRWPDRLPAFSVARTPTLFVDPQGRAWIRRLHLGEEPALYDVFDRKGVRVRQVRLEANERLVGFGRAGLLVAVRDADELEALRLVRFDFR